MDVKTFIEGFRGNDSPSIVYHNKEYSYEWLYQRIQYFVSEFNEKGIKTGSVVELSTDFSPEAIAALFALLYLHSIVVPLTNVIAKKKEEYRHIVCPEFAISINSEQEISYQTFASSLVSINSLLLKLRQMNHPGLIIMSSGSTGNSKAIVHDFLPLISKFNVPGKQLRIIAFLLFDHIGGINTMLYTLFNRGTLVVPKDRTPLHVCEAIEKHHVAALTTSPSFLNLLLLSGYQNSYNLSTLKNINYGSESMPESLLNKLNQQFPKIRFSQAYGLSELGVLNVKSKSSDSLYIKLDNKDSKMRIVDGMLQIKSQCSMLGYLNAISPLTDDGWFKTGDMVVQEGDYIRILGRASEIINVGGEKVYPAEVENILLTMNGVEDVVVVGEPNPIMGSLVKARVKLSAENSNHSEARKAIRSFCKDKLPGYMVPQKIEFVDNFSHGERYKKMRNKLVDQLTTMEK